MVGQFLRRVGMNVQLAEPAAERLVLFDRHLLVAEEDHQILHQRIVHFLELLVAEILRQIDTENFGADDRIELPHFNRLVGSCDLLLVRFSIERENDLADVSVMLDKVMSGSNIPSRIGPLDRHLDRAGGEMRQQVVRAGFDAAERLLARARPERDPDDLQAEERQAIHVEFAHAAAHATDVDQPSIHGHDLQRLRQRRSTDRVDHEIDTLFAGCHGDRGA